MRKVATYLCAGASLAALSGAAFAQASQGEGALPAAQPRAAAEATDELVPRDEIVVSARRREEALQDVPLSVQVVTGNQLAKLEVRNFQDVATVVPGLQLTRASNGVQNTVTMRGISFNATAAGPQTAVELYRNDVVTSSAAIFQALYDIQQIEVLRGPQGTLRGRASPSGSITITTRRPDLNEVGGFMEGVLAEEGAFNVTGAVNVPIVAGVLGARVAGYVSDGPANQIDRVNLFTRAVDTNSSDEVQSIRASVRADPFDGVLLLDANYETTKRKTRSFEQYQSRRFVDGTALTGPVDISSRDRLGIQLDPLTFNGTYKFYNWQAQLRQFGQMLTYVGGRLDARSDSVVPEDNAGILRNTRAPAAVPNAFGVVNLNQFAQRTSSIQKQRFHEIRLQSDERIAGIFDYVVGYMSLKADTPTLLYTTTSSCIGGSSNCPVGGLGNVTLGGTYRIRSDEEQSFYGNLTVHLGENTEISGGLRHIKFERISGLQSAPRAGATPSPDFAPVELIRAQPEVASFAVDDGVKHTIYTLSAKHKFSDDLMVYATYGTSFRPGNIVVCARCNNAEGAILNAGGFLRPRDETSESIEGGFKASLFDGRVTANLSVFHQKFENYTVISPEQVQFLSNLNPPTLALSGSTNSLVLTNPVRITGLEAELGYRPSDRFNIGANIAYTDSKVRDGRVPCLDLNNDNFQDTVPVPNTPEGRAAFAAGITPAGGFVDTCAISSASPAPSWSASVQGEYNHPFSDTTEAYLRGLLAYNGKTNGEDINPVDSVSAYALLNLYAGVRDPDGVWDVSVFVKNLTNTHRVLTRTGSRATSTIGGALFTSDYYRITTTVPRQFGVSAKITFGSR